jgi:hypothetical protein
MQTKNGILSLCILAAALGLVSCEFFGSLGIHELVISSPSRPEIWRGIPHIEYRLTWRNPEGLIEEASLKEGESISIRVARGAFQCLRMECLARYSAAGHEYRLRPAGILYPFESSRIGDALQASWTEGYICEVGASLERGGYDPAMFNLSRLETLLEEKGIDPWLRSGIRTARDLAEGRFRGEDFDPRDLFPVDLPLPGPWYPESPFGRPVVESLKDFKLDLRDRESKLSGSSRLSVDLPIGIHAFSGPGGGILVELGEDGRGIWVRSPVSE